MVAKRSTPHRGTASRVRSAYLISEIRSRSPYQSNAGARPLESIILTTTSAEAQFAISCHHGARGLRQEGHDSVDLTVAARMRPAAAPAPSSDILMAIATMSSPLPTRSESIRCSSNSNLIVPGGNQRGGVTSSCGARHLHAKTPAPRTYRSVQYPIAAVLPRRSEPPRCANVRSLAVESSPLGSRIQGRVEAHAMGSDKIRAKKQAPDSWPQHFESGLSPNMFPGDAMYGREEEGTSRRADQVIFPLHDSSARNANETDRASAIGIVVGRLEIDRDEGQGTP